LTVNWAAVSGPGVVHPEPGPLERPDSHLARRGPDHDGLAADAGAARQVVRHGSCGNAGDHTQIPTALTWNNLKPGTYLIHSGTHPSIQHPMGLYGVLVVTAAPANNILPGTAYGLNTTAPVTYSAEVPLLLSEIDPVQNRAVAAAGGDRRLQ